MRKEPNIILIVIDALRVKNLSCYGRSGLNSPNIDRLAREGVLFENAYACINATDPSLTTIFSGKYPISHGIINHGSKVSDEEIKRFYASNTLLLPQVLKSKGYVTLAVDWLGRWHRRGYDYYSGILKDGLFRGQSKGDLRKKSMKRVLYIHMKRLRRLLARFLFLSSLQMSRTNVYGDASLVTNKAIELIKGKENLDRSFFLFLHYWDTHTPYNSPKANIRELNNDAEHFYIEDVIGQIRNKVRRNYVRQLGSSVSEIVAKYNGAISFIDHEIGRLIKKLDQQELLDETILIITGDHGESLTEHGVYFDHHCLYEDIIHIPLVLKAPFLPRNKRVRGFVQHTDIMPTILDILNEKVDEYFDGESLLPLIYGQTDQLHKAIYVEEVQTQWKRLLMTDGYKYIYAPSEENAVCSSCGIVHGGLEELYDLTNDPSEKENIVEKRREIADMLRKQLDEWINYLKGKREKENIRSKIQRLKGV